MSTKDKDFDADKLFTMMMERHRKGDVLITVATGELNEEVSERSGLVSTHAYAVLDLRLVEVKLYCSLLAINDHNCVYI